MRFNTNETGKERPSTSAKKWDEGEGRKTDQQKQHVTSGAKKRNQEKQKKNQQRSRTLTKVATKRREWTKAKPIRGRRWAKGVKIYEVVADSGGESSGGRRKKAGGSEGGGCTLKSKKRAPFQASRFRGVR